MLYVPRGTLIELFVTLSGMTVARLRTRARELRDRHGYEFKGLWRMRKQVLSRKVADAELDLLFLRELSADEEVNIMLSENLRTFVCKSVKGAVREGVRDAVNEVGDELRVAAQQADADEQSPELTQESVFGPQPDGTPAIANGKPEQGKPASDVGSGSKKANNRK